MLPAVALGLALIVTGCTAPAPPEQHQDSSQTPTGPAAEPAKVAVELRTLVLDDGSNMIRSLADRLVREGVPVERVLLGDRSRKAVTRDMLAGTDASGAVTAHFSGIVAPSLTSGALTAAEQATLSEYVSTFGVRSVRTDMTALFPENFAEVSTDGAKVNFSEAAAAGPFSYLQRSITFDESEAGGYRAPKAGRPPKLAAAAQYQPLATMDVPGGGTADLLAVTREGNREEMLVTLEGDPEQAHIQALTHGIIRWLNRDVTTSYSRNYFSVDSDDVLLPNAQWSVAGHCEVGRNCPPTVEQLPPIRMTAADIDYLVAWQQGSGIKVSLALNGAGAGEHALSNSGRDALMEQMVAQRSELRILNHTWNHNFLGCDRVLLPDDWRCLGDDKGNTRWMSKKDIYAQVAKNQLFVEKNGLENYNQTELVTGEHSGLAKPPQQPTDNPNLAPALDEAGIKWVASDTSTEAEPRQIGGATTVPRYPIDLDYNTPTGRQVADAYNWKNTSKADGGSGECETATDNPCVAPINIDTGFNQVIAPMEGEKAYAHVVANDARPHFVHQANFTGDRVIYPMLDNMLGRYHATFADSSPLLNPTMSEAGTDLMNHRHWSEATGHVVASVAGQTVRLSNTGTTPALVPVTVPEGARTVRDGQLTGGFGTSYQGATSDWVSVAPGATVTIQTSATSGFATDATWSAKGN
ncbi:hypothetical protein [Granulicoccus phenolivorans]|uniref:hypothetical protein n=1 Tax=Granulicoccus phenolivorans TaxID=266854 RepID=UPI0011AE3201|nr:hypothetical protein [Granulicoccus phenolivorans]